MKVNLSIGSMKKLSDVPFGTCFILKPAPAHRSNVFMVCEAKPHAQQEIHRQHCVLAVCLEDGGLEYFARNCDVDVVEMEVNQVK